MITVSSAKRPLYLALVQFQPGFQKNPRERLHDVGLVHDRHFLASGRHGVLEREFQQAPAALAGVDAGGHGDRVRIVVDLDVMLVAYVQSFEIFAHHHQIDVVEATAGDEGASGAQIGVQLELLAQAHVRGAVAAARGGLERSLQGQARAANAVDGAGRQRVSRGLHAFQAGDLPIPLERRPERIEGGKRRIHDLGADPVPGDQGRGNRRGILCGHRRSILDLRNPGHGGCLASVPDADEIYRRNILTLRMLGREGWRKLWSD